MPADAPKKSNAGQNQRPMVGTVKTGPHKIAVTPLGPPKKITAGIMRSTPDKTPFNPRGRGKRLGGAKG